MTGFPSTKAPKGWVGTTSYSHGYTDGCSLSYCGRGGKLVSGIVATPHGYVRVFSLFQGLTGPDDLWGRCTRLWFIHGGRMHMRDFARLLPHRTAVIQAGKFAREVARSKS